MQINLKAETATLILIRNAIQERIDQYRRDAERHCQGAYMRTTAAKMDVVLEQINIQIKGGPHGK